MSNKVNEKIGSVKVADDVVPCIAALAAAEIDGVISVAENLTAEIIGRMGMRKAPKGVKVEIKGRKVYVDMALGIDYGYNVPETSRKVQEKVKIDWGLGIGDKYPHRQRCSSEIRTVICRERVLLENEKKGLQGTDFQTSVSGRV